MNADLTGKFNDDLDSEEEFLEKYQEKDYDKPSVTTSIVCITWPNNGGDYTPEILLIERKKHPYKGYTALPGGFLYVGPDRLNQGESLEECVIRETFEETGILVLEEQLRQIYAFGKPGRDPRTRVIDIIYFANITQEQAMTIKAGDDALTARWCLASNFKNYKFAFDHGEAIKLAFKSAGIHSPLFKS